MKKSFKKLLALLLTLTASVSMFACGPKPVVDPDNSALDEPTDYTKYQLNVSTYDGGFGYSWLYAVKERYEELHENDLYANGTLKGVQVKINPIKEKAGELAESVLGGVDDVYFTEYAYFYELYEKGIFGDISEAVTGANADLSVYNGGDAAGTTIESKMTEEQQDYFKVNGKYYGIPHYAGYNGIVYNKGLFDSEGYYFAKTPVGTNREGKFISASNPEKSAGPNGSFGDYDDGLPATYEEFFELCKWIDECETHPVVTVNGNSYNTYLNGLIGALSSDYEGLEQYKINYSFNGTAKNLVKMDNGKVVTDGNGNFVLDSNDTVITQNNGYEVARQAGKLYGLQFVERLITEDNSAYMNNTGDKSFDEPTYSHMSAQRDFIHDETRAMLVDGIWWQSEATQAFKDKGWDKKDCDYAWMPLPKATADQVGDPVTLGDYIYSMCFMKGNLTGEEKEIALDFIKFCNTNQSLVEFTQITDTPKALNYTLTDDEKADLSPFAKSVLHIKELPTTKIVYPIGNSDFYQANQRMICEIFYSTLDGFNHLQAAPTFINSDNTKTAEDYFEGMYKYRTGIWSDWLAQVGK